MRYNRIKTCDTQNTNGLCVSLWLQGCPHRCEGCWNPETWDYEGGIVFGDREIEYILDQLSYNQNLAVLGGEPLIERNIQPLLQLFKMVKEVRPKSEIWVWTGYDYKEIEHLELLNYVDYIIDGKFDKNNKVDFRITKFELDRFRGSSNQNVINLNKKRGN